MNLKQLRLQAELSQEQVALALKVPDRTVRRWENGESKTPSDVISKLAELYNVSVESVLEAITGEKK